MENIKSIQNFETDPLLVFGAYLKQKRYALNISVREICKSSGISPSTINRWEEGGSVPAVEEDLNKIILSYKFSEEEKTEVNRLFQISAEAQRKMKDAKKNRKPEPISYIKSSGPQAPSSGPKIGHRQT